VSAYIEMTPFDLVKYEIDKHTGHLKVDRPQRSSSLLPSIYGFIPRTFCDREVAARNNKSQAGDADPLDICVISEQPISRAEVIVHARVLGGIRTLDDGQADDKIISVLEGDTVWGQARSVEDVSASLIDRLRHYFATYKLLPGGENRVQVQETYDRDEACSVIEAAIADYDRCYGLSGPA
jgi:inorganic pyrophosphatase